MIFIGSLRYFFLRWHQVGGRYPNRQLSEQALRAACGGPASGAVSVPVSDRDAPLAGQLFAGAPRSTRGPRPGGPARARVPFFRARGRPNPSSPSNAAQARTRGKLRLPRTPTGAARGCPRASSVERGIFWRRSLRSMRSIRRGCTLTIWYGASPPILVGFVRTQPPPGVGPDAPNLRAHAPSPRGDDAAAAAADADGPA